MAVIEQIKGELFHLSHSIDENPQIADFNAHIHDSYELFCFVNGDANYSVEGNLYKLQSGAIMLMRSSETHKLVLNSSCEYERYVLNFSPSILLDTGFSRSLLAPFRDRGIGQKNMYLPSEFSHVSPISFFEKMFLERDVLNDNATVVSNLCALLCQICLAFSKKNEQSNSENLVERDIIWFVNENLTRDITTNDVASYVHLSPSQVSRIFKRATGTSIHDYIITKRLIRFNKLIDKGESVLNACKLCGFNDYSSFYRLYKKRFGVSPSKKAP